MTTFGFVPRKKAERRRRDDDPTFVDIESLDGASVYHLKLVPRFRPDRNPIRGPVKYVWMADHLTVDFNLRMAILAIAGSARRAAQHPDS